LGRFFIREGRKERKMILEDLGISNEWVVEEKI